MNFEAFLDALDPSPAFIDAPVPAKARGQLSLLPLAPGVKGRDYGLRHYQEECKEAVFAALEENRSCLVVMATGLGKTVLFSALAGDWERGDVLVLVHRDELVRQAQATLERMTGEMVEIEQGELRASANSRIVVASTQSITRQARLDRLGKDRFGLIVVDECFPAGTLVSGRKIEEIRVGDTVECVAHATGLLGTGKVTRVFSRPSRAGIVIRTDATALRCTENHPVFVRRGSRTGYVEAKEVRVGDMLCVRNGIFSGDLLIPGASEDLREDVQVLDLLSEDGGDQPALCVEENDRPEPDEKPGNAGKGSGFTGQNRPCSTGSGRERKGPNGSPAGASGGAWGRVGSGARDPDEEASWLWVPDGIQGRPGPSGVARSGRGGRVKPLVVTEKSSGPEEGTPLGWSRVDSVARAEFPGDEPVYNLEVEGGHTYFANGALVHNCHHYLAPSFRRPIEFFADAKVVGVTATPDRGDERALGDLFDVVAYTRDILDGIDDGYLAPVEAFNVTCDHIDLSHVKASGGDLNESQLDEVMLRSVEEVVAGTMKEHGHLPGIWFWPGVKSAEYAAARFNQVQPGSTGFVSGATPPEQRREVIADFRDGRLLRLMNCAVLTEGFDAPRCRIVGMARPTKSRALAAQIAGRGTRPVAKVDGIPGAEGAAARRALIAASEKPSCILLNFVGNAGQHSLVTPEDALGGNFSEEEVTLAKKKRKQGGDVGKSLEEARAELRRIAATVAAKAQTRVERFDPFGPFGLERDGSTTEMRFGRKAMTPKQRETLMKFGLKDAHMETMSRGDAGRFLDEAFRRIDAGLANFRQMSILKQYGVTETEVPFGRAKAAIKYIAENNWRVKDPARLAAILHAPREPGED